MMLSTYILDGKNVVQCEDIMKWAIWFETADVHVALETIGIIRISTVFLGIDHNFNHIGKPVLFETMVFNGKRASDEMDRYCTWDEAEAGHKEIVADIKRHPWNRIIKPWVRFYMLELRFAMIKLINKILMWMWPVITKTQVVIRNLIDKIRMGK